MSAFERLYFDTNIFVLRMEELGAIHSMLERMTVIPKVAERHLIVTSALTISELLVRPLRDGNLSLASIYQSWFETGGWSEIIEIDRTILELAALLRAERPGLKTPDAIHLATALQARCSHFLTADMKIRSIDGLVHPFTGPLSFTPLAVIRPDAPTLSSILQSLAA